ncbi:MAG: hypothetical protein DRR42_11680 [Gammaproteobacteria bacterium]|nr:MAG: hypothetical protein DRR42_11680 [Gammaproteobacteria bacterium]
MPSLAKPEYTCPRCGGGEPLIPLSKWLDRRNSRVVQVKCTRCEQYFFLKQVLDSPETSSLGLSEYHTLQEVHRCFPIDDAYRVSRPLDYIEKHRTIVMTYEKGEPLLHALRNVNDERRREILKNAGGWLARLHHCRRVTSSDAGAKSRLSPLLESLETESDYLDKTIQNAMRLLAEVLPQLHEETDKSVWIHGDFTPDNVLVNRGTTIGLDIAWVSQANPVLDLAPFLNHLSIALQPVFGLGGGERHYQLEEAFLKGYSGKWGFHRKNLLIWYRLYFLLCYRRTSIKAGFVRRSITKVRFNPLIFRLSSELALLTKYSTE